MRHAQNVTHSEHVINWDIEQNFLSPRLYIYCIYYREYLPENTYVLGFFLI